MFSVLNKCHIIFRYTDLIISDGDQLQLLIGAGREYRTLALHSYNASKLSALAYDATTEKLFFSDLRHLHGHIFSVDLEGESPVKDIVESIISYFPRFRCIFLSLFFPTENDNETVESMTYDPVDKMLLWVDGFNKSIRRIQVDDDDNVHPDNEKAGVEMVHFLNKDDKPRGLVSDPCTR